MLRLLDIRDALIIDRLEMAFRPGLTVLTGETGAGKSILLDALGFVLGWRTRSDLPRRGAAQAEVVAEFELVPNHPARAILAAAGLPSEDTLILRRISRRDGRKTAWVNDRRCSTETLRQLSAQLVELHGQHEDRGVLNTRQHRALLDDFGRLHQQRSQVAQAWQRYAQAQEALAQAAAARADVQVRSEYIEHALAEFMELAPEPQEAAALSQRRRLMQQAEHIRQDVARAQAALGSEGAETMMGNALRWLADAARTQEDVAKALAPAQAALDNALVELDEARDCVARCLETLDFDPLELEQTEERLFAIRALARKHGVAAEALPEVLADLRSELARLTEGAQQEDALKAQLQGAQARYDKHARALSAARKSAAARLRGMMRQEFAPLRMGRMDFAVAIDACAPGAEGQETIAFVVAPDAGTPAGPLGKIASGGELSRFMLALKVCLRRAHSGATMIFDEIDRGVGGATADAVGQRLASLAQGGQVLVVTHAPQVAAFATHHFLVRKGFQGGQEFSGAVLLAETARVDEIARMLSGDSITDEARAAAHALLAAAARSQQVP
ncbi:MAG: DNA repair protein RecN [Rhodobacteraceae bacterium]|nr:DNA repair protein RecN [Paracoccaceae bacterium]